MRTYDVNKVKAATAQYAREIEGFHPEEWLANEKNIALINDKDDVALFEHQADLLNTVCGHYFFFSRGKEAVKAAEQFLEEVFETTYVQSLPALTAFVSNNDTGSIDCPSAVHHIATHNNSFSIFIAHKIF